MNTTVEFQLVHQADIASAFLFQNSTHSTLTQFKLQFRTFLKHFPRQTNGFIYKKKKSHL